MVVFLDDDVSIQPDLFALLEEAYPDLAIVGVTGRVVEPESTRRLGPGSTSAICFPGAAGRRTFTRYGYPRYLRDLEPARRRVHAGLLHERTREAAAAVRFDEHMGGYALAEDEDFSYRLSRIGRIRYLPQLIVRHRKLGFGSADERRFGARRRQPRLSVPEELPADASGPRAVRPLVAMLVGHGSSTASGAARRGSSKGRIRCCGSAADAARRPARSASRRKWSSRG